ncbi:uncharacterized protein K452DRAFT_293460 [Aplosporella prunicola CBS 121167]|uniref:Uncharacterized protein n=1 Tax=Aplosporella prunicola CBS 121167 TaxID=1176127 RepID=A0A6A6AVY3_9PEZI|nr:uncharacterized protein K452DRAFT_293460 [Aplosporella prunicola CBS 121167]KAF2135114.1 hypothetical protein K452DRAFT_293460 [Aplosporella prunicola CBS 121167]
MPQMAYCGDTASALAAPTYPPPCKANLRPAGSHSDYPPSGHDSVISHSYSNTARDARSSSTSQSMQVPPGIPAHVAAPEPAVSGDMMCKDPEKQADFPTSNGRRSRNHMPSNGPDDLYYQSDVDEAQLEDKALGILVRITRC